MDTKRVITAVAAALVVGVVAGNVVSGWAAAPAATTSNTSTATAPARLGLRLGAAMQAGGARLSDVVAKLTGLSASDVTDKRTAGTSYAAIASSKGVSSDAVIAESLKVREALLADKVEAKTITQEQADAALSNMKTRLTERVSATDDSCTGTGGGGRGMGGGQGRGAGRGMGGAACTNPVTATN